jgi:hypothetical protein
MAQGLLLVISGPSGVGKGTLCQALREEVPEIIYSISTTTRQPRPGEVDGKSYYFIGQQNLQFKMYKLALEKSLNASLYKGIMCNSRDYKSCYSFKDCFRYDIDNYFASTNACLCKNQFGASWFYIRSRFTKRLFASLK